MHIVILGGGPAGYEAALVAAEAGADVTLVSDEGLGGNSVLWDCVPSKALIVSATAMDWMESAHRLGVRLESGADIAARACVDLAAVMDRIAQLGRDQSADIVRKVADSGARIIEGYGRLSGQDAVAVEHRDGRETDVSADVVLVATGSRPRVLPFFEPDGERVFTARDLFALRELPERLIVVGSGATGAEFAHAFAAFGSEVHLVSSRSQVLPQEDPDAAAVIADVFERRGMMLHRQRRAIDLELTSAGVRVQLDPASKTGEVGPAGDEEWVEGSHVLFCVGQVPASDGIGLDAAGVAVAGNGAIEVDGVSRTNVPRIYAAGDVTGGVMLASAAAMRGRVAMWHALGMAVAPLRTETIAATIFTDPEVASVGLTPTQCRDHELPFRTVTLQFTGNPRAKMVEATDGFVKIHAMEGSGTVLGASVVAKSASDLVTPLSVAVENRLTVSQLAHSFTVYPSMGGSLQETARMLMAQMQQL